LDKFTSLENQSSSGGRGDAMPHVEAQTGETESGKLFPIDPTALARLAQGTSVLIATLLAIPDAVALIPGASSLLGWILKLIGVWISAAVLWFVGFLAILHGMRLIVQGVRVGADGIKLWRFARVIKWDTVDAVAVEPQFFFSQILSLKPPAQRLTIFASFKSRRFFWEKLLVPHPVPSFLFSHSDFTNLVNELCQQKFQFAPDGISGVFYAPANQLALKRTYKALDWQKVIVSVIIAIGLVCFLGRKASVNYIYNSGNKALARNDLEQAKRLYEVATSIDPFFYAPWNNLATVEFRKGDFDEAYEHWQRALALKPDFVEPMVSLSYLALQKRNFVQAKELIDRALMLAPLNPYALVNRADYYMRLGHAQQAMKDARVVLSQAELKDHRPKFMACCLIAQGQIRLGRADEAIALLRSLESTQDEYFVNRTFWLLVNAEAHLAHGDIDEAERYVTQAASRAPGNLDVLLDLARLKIARRRYEEAKEVLAKVQADAPQNPWVYLLRAKVHLLQSEADKANAELDRAIGLGAGDAQLHADAARIFLQLGNRRQAVESAKRALFLEPDIAPAAQVLEEFR